VSGYKTKNKSKLF